MNGGWRAGGSCEWWLACTWLPFPRSLRALGLHPVLDQGGTIHGLLVCSLFPYPSHHFAQKPSVCRALLEDRAPERAGKLGMPRLCLGEPCGHREGAVWTCPWFYVQTLLAASLALLLLWVSASALRSSRAVLRRQQQLALFPQQTFLLFWDGKLFHAILYFSSHYV